MKGSDLRPRICVFRSALHTYAQIISDEAGTTLVSASTLDKDVVAQAKALSGDKASTKSISAAKAVGMILGKRAKEKKIAHVFFDRNGFVYHGRIKAVADGARESGLDF